MRREILVVDDDADLRETLQLLLDDSGYGVTAVASGQEALDRLKAGDRPSLILLDLMMPELDGFGFIEELRGKEEWRKIPVVVLTAKDISSEDRTRLEGCTSAVLVKKGQSPDALIREMRDLIQQATGTGVSV